MDWSALASAGIIFPSVTVHHILQNIAQNYGLSFVSIAVDLYKFQTSQKQSGHKPIHGSIYSTIMITIIVYATYLQETIKDSFPQFTVYQIIVMEH